MAAGLVMVETGGEQDLGGRLRNVGLTGDG
jgi:hypothetical protein